MRAAEWLEVVEARDQDALEASLRGEPDPGEAAAIALARSLDADLPPIAVRQGRRIARRLDLAVKGTLGLLMQARRQAHLDRVRPVLERLEEEGVWIEPSLLRSALDAVGEDPDDS